MIYSPKIKEAVALAIRVHAVDEKQLRKGKDIPYITHPLTVGLILAATGADEDVIAAGILHDTIEDSVPEKKVTREMIAAQFGERVAALVVSVTELEKAHSWDERKNEAISHIPSFSHDSLIKSGDLISNANEIVDDYAQHGETMFTRFSAPKEKVLWYYTEAARAVLAAWPENPLAQDLDAILEKLKGLE